MRVPFILYKRSAGAKGGKVYYAAFRDQQTQKYGQRRSNGQTSRANAEAGARRIIDKGLQNKSGLTLIGYIEDFWQDSGSYAASKKARRHAFSGDHQLDTAIILRSTCRGGPPWPFEDNPGIRPKLMESLSADGRVLVLTRGSHAS
jgi:hypothetical protein